MVVSKHSVQSLRVASVVSGWTAVPHLVGTVIGRCCWLWCRCLAAFSGDGCGKLAVNECGTGQTTRLPLYRISGGLTEFLFLPQLSEWPPVFFSACSARVGNNISGSSCSNFWHLLEAGGRRDGGDDPGHPEASLDWDCCCGPSRKKYPKIY